MGQKVHPYVLRIGYTKLWRSIWYANPKEFKKNLIEDKKIREYLIKELKRAAVSHIDIERLGGNKMRITIHSARPGVIIGRKGVEIEKLKSGIDKIVKDLEVYIDTREITAPELDAKIVADEICFQIERRVPYKRAVNSAIEKAFQAGAGGIKISVAGRLGGAEIARTEVFKKGKIPLSTLKADIDYAISEAFTTYGTIGVKVWIYLGDAIPLKERFKQEVAQVSS